MAVARLKTDGSMDTTFGSSGIVTTPLGGSCGGAPTHGSGVLIQPDGKILVSAWNGPGCNATVLRYSSTGVLDSTFGSGGIAQAPVAGRSVQAQDLALTADGRVVVVGISKVGEQDRHHRRPVHLLGPAGHDLPREQLERHRHLRRGQRAQRVPDCGHARLGGAHHRHRQRVDHPAVDLCLALELDRRGRRRRSAPTACSWAPSAAPPRPVLAS